MNRIALVLVASLVPQASAFAMCDGQTGQDQLDCVNDNLERAARLIDRLNTQLNDTQAELDVALTDLADAESRLAAVEADYVVSADLSSYAESSDLDGYATTSALDAYALSSDLDTAAWSDAADLVDTWATYLSVDAGTDSVVFTGANVYVQSGSGSTEGTVDGTGNLIIGYDEGSGAKTGSHNLVLGAENAYSSYGGLVAGYSNEVSGAYASVVGGNGGTASGRYSAILGGQNGSARGEHATVAGGFSNVSGGTYSVAVGGYDNAVYESDSVVVGGTYNTVVDGASGYSNVLVGGFQATLDGGLFYSVLSYGSDETMTSNGHMY